MTKDDERELIGDWPCASIQRTIGVRPSAGIAGTPACRPAGSSSKRAALYDSNAYTDELPSGSMSRASRISSCPVAGNQRRGRSCPERATAHDFFTILRDAFDVPLRGGRQRPKDDVGPHPSAADRPSFTHVEASSGSWIMFSEQAKVLICLARTFARRSAPRQPSARHG